MRHPFWIINSSLLLLLVVALGFVAFSRPAIPQPRPVKAKTTSTTTAKTMGTLSISLIYNNDLFNTYHEQLAAPEEPNYTKPIPTPPSPTPVVIPEEPKQPFLPPLDVTLKGIMLVNDDSMSIAIIQDNKTKKDENYKVGDPLEDAQIIRILQNRIILIRSNGQQETLYLTEKDVLTDPAFSKDEDDWGHITKKITDNSFLLDPEEFAKLVPNLAHFIDLFDLTTVYREGKSIGCRIGKVTENSLGEAMGLQSYDIVKKVANIPATTTNERLKIYDALTALNLDETFSAEISRDDHDITITFKLYDLRDPLKKLDGSAKKIGDNEEKTGILKGPSPEDLERERIATLKEKYSFAPTTQEIMIQQRKHMLAEGKEERLNAFSLSNGS